MRVAETERTEGWHTEALRVSDRQKANKWASVFSEKEVRVFFQCMCAHLEDSYHSCLHCTPDRKGGTGVQISGRAIDIKSVIIMRQQKIAVVCVMHIKKVFIDRKHTRKHNFWYLGLTRSVQFIPQMSGI